MTPRPRPEFTLTAGRYHISLGQRTRIMGIINVTPDSFSGDGQYRSGMRTRAAAAQTVLRLARKFIRDGADILDIGGESSRPGARPVCEKEEIRRVIPCINLLAQKTNIPISVDTYKTSVAQHALDAGASIVNIIKGTSLSQGLLKMIRNYNAAVVLMHMKGTPRTMQKNVFYKDVTKEILLDLRKSVEKCLENGIKSDKIIIDPGFGFGKTADHNLEILNRLDAFHVLNQPILIGTSRKSFIGKILNRESHQRLTGSIAAMCAGIMKGAHIVRVHDVKQSKEAARIIDAILSEKII